MLVPIIFLIYVQAGELSNLRIWGGRDAEPNEFPYVVAIENRNKKGKESTETFSSHCTGSLIAPSWTLTAGHCVEFAPSRQNKLVITYTMDGKKTRYNVLYMIAHPNMILNLKNAANDIGLMKNEEVKHVTYAKLSAVDYTTLVGLEALSVGYGRMNTDNGLEAASSGNNTLQVMEVMFIRCFDLNLNKPAMCTTTKCGVNSFICSGDSGGPIIHKSGVVAVHSMGHDCRKTNILPRKLGVFEIAGISAPVSPYFSWILEQMRLGNV
ncbi:unnamed protein product [Colias eurytheme]|nr:unnamed protein product [Colias eurytheme]